MLRPELVEKYAGGEWKASGKSEVLPWDELPFSSPWAPILGTVGYILMQVVLTRVVKEPMSFKPLVRSVVGGVAAGRRLRALRRQLAASFLDLAFMLLLGPCLSSSRESFPTTHPDSVNTSAAAAHCDCEPHAMLAAAHAAILTCCHAAPA